LVLEIRNILLEGFLGEKKLVWPTEREVLEETQVILTLCILDLQLTLTSELYLFL